MPAHILPAMRRLIVLAALATMVAACGGQTVASPDHPVRILAGTATTLDPAAQSDAGTAAITAQLFESLTSFDADRQVRPALAESWRFDAGGKRVTFHLRPGLTFSDGSPLRPSDVVRSWMRLIDPASPSPLASLILDVSGAAAFLQKQSSDPASVGLHGDDGTGDLVVDLVRPATDFVNIVAGPTFAIVPPGIAEGALVLTPGPGFVGSGGYVATKAAATGLTLSANPRYWAGKPAVATIELLGDLGGKGAVDAFAAGDVDYTPVASIDATWLGYDETLGPQLRTVDSLSVQYYGFDTRTAPFDDARVRKAFGEAVDWRRMAALGSADGTAKVATSMVPPGIPGRSGKDYLPVYDPADARKLLSDAGFPGGAGFPATILMTDGSRFDAGIVAEVKRELGITLQAETMGDGYFGRLATDPPAMWSLAWVADYPGPNDFLGVLLGTGASNNYGHWSSPEFDAAVADAVGATDPAVASTAYDRAETIVRDQVPVIPVTYGVGSALSRTGLLGAGQNGLDIIRMAGLAWAQ
ncbi:MAG: peptide/nickel transport system substrate-binding protein [Chloroflexota bacterium]|nr:peptide/nickel transport system substrate-binding protein [Chloroflexota bacterium]